MLAGLGRSEQLVHPAWTHSLISGAGPGTHPSSGHVIFEVGNNGADSYTSGHIPGAVYLDTRSLEEPPLWNRLPAKRLESALLAYGVCVNKMVVLYSKEDPMATARIACLLMYAGVSDVRLLDGGFDAWTAAGHDVEADLNKPVPVAAFGGKIPGHPEFIADTEDVRSYLHDENTVLVNMRTWEEYIGETRERAHSQWLICVM